MSRQIHSPCQSCRANKDLTITTLHSEDDQSFKKKWLKVRNTPLKVPQRKAAQSDPCQNEAFQHDGLQQHIQKVGQAPYFWTSLLLSEYQEFIDEDEYNTNN